MAQDFLSNIELFFAEEDNFAKNKIVISGDEFKHLTNVMRHNIGDLIHITNGNGSIFIGEIEVVEKRAAVLNIKNQIKYKNDLSNIWFCFPLLKIADRFDFAIEKSVELGITNIIIYEGDRSFRKGDKSQRWQKIAISAMKQSLRSYLPNIIYKKSIKEIINLGNPIYYFDQSAKTKLVNFKIEHSKKQMFLFGAEGGFSEKELKLLKDCNNLQLTENRLRAETAVITAASIISTSIL